MGPVLRRWTFTCTLSRLLQLENFSNIYLFTVLEMIENAE
jgi:hypothetical protein